jgi:hypothetical protein
MWCRCELRADSVVAQSGSGLVTVTEVLSWFRDAASKGPYPTAAQVETLVVRINEFHNALQDDRRKLLKRMADQARERREKVHDALTVLKNELPRIIAIERMLAPEPPELKDPALELVQLLNSVRRAGSLGRSTKRGRPRGVRTHALAETLGWFVEGAWRAAGRKSLSRTKAEGPYLQVLIRALDAVEGKRHSAETLRSAFKLRKPGGGK